jgi:transcriptional regulator with XRE-family HTH domain
MSKKKSSYSQDERAEEIYQFVRNWRLNEGLSQREFSMLADRHVNTVQNLESGKNITLQTLLAFIDAMQISPAQFFEDIG